MEKWVWIKGYEGLYQISNLGNVKSFKTNKLLSNKRIDGSGYAQVALRKNGKVKELRINRLVAFHFIGDPENDKLTVNHKDGIKLNNKVDNLEWATLSEQMIHAYKNGLKKPVKGCRTVDKETQEEIKQLYQKGKRGRSALALGKKFGISPSTVERIVRNYA